MNNEPPPVFFFEPLFLLDGLNVSMHYTDTLRLLATSENAHLLYSSALNVMNVIAMARCSRLQFENFETMISDPFVGLTVSINVLRFAIKFLQFSKNVDNKKK